MHRVKLPQAHRQRPLSRRAVCARVRAERVASSVFVRVASRVRASSRRPDSSSPSPRSHLVAESFRRSPSPSRRVAVLVPRPRASPRASRARARRARASTPRASRSVAVARVDVAVARVEHNENPSRIAHLARGSRGSRPVATQKTRGSVAAGPLLIEESTRARRRPSHSTTRAPRRPPIATHDVRAHDAVLRPRDARARDGDEEDDDADARCDARTRREGDDDDARDAAARDGCDAMATARRGTVVGNFTARIARARGGGEGARARARGGRGDDGSAETLNLDENPDARDGASAREGGIGGRASSDDDERLTEDGMSCFFRTNSRARRGFGLF